MEMVAGMLQMRRAADLTSRAGAILPVPALVLRSGRQRARRAAHLLDSQVSELLPVWEC